MPDPTPSDSIGASRRWRQVGVGWLAVFGLAGFAFALPLFRVLGPSPEFFLAHGISPGGVVVLALVVAVAVPAFAATVATVVGLRSVAMRGVVVGAIGVIGAAGVLQPVAGARTFPLLALAGGAMVALSEARVAAVRSGLAVLAAVSLATGGWFVGLSRTSTYVFAGSSSAVDVAAAPDRPLSPVVFLVFDELPMTALLQRDLTINEHRFPNFARLAGQSDWYRLGSSVSPDTAQSVPAVLSGTAPTTDVAVASNYPSNLFLQLGGLHHVFAYEPITGLCPDSVCRDHSVTAEAPATEAPVSSDPLAKDTLVVFGHAVGSDAMREDLAPIDHSWSSFSAPLDLVGVETDPFIRDYRQVGNEATFVGASAELRALTSRRPDGDRPPMYVAHLITPHLPYIANPSGSVYGMRSLVGMTTEDASLTWPADGPEATRRQAYQRLLLQIGAVDTLLGQVIDELKRDGLWDQAAVVVTADHGASFEEGYFRSVRAGGAEVWNVPLFVKGPGQQRGIVSDAAALTIDAVPTLLGLLDLVSPSDFDGVDLNSTSPETRAEGYNDRGTTVTIEQSIDAVRDVVHRRSAWIDPDGGWEHVYRVGPGGALVGLPVPDTVSEGPGVWWADPTPAGVIPTVRTLTVNVDDGDVPQGVVVAAGDRMVGTGAPLVPIGEGTYEVTVVIDEATAASGTAVDLYAVGANDTLTRLSRGEVGDR